MWVIPLKCEMSQNLNDFILDKEGRNTREGALSLVYYIVFIKIFTFFLFYKSIQNLTRDLPAVRTATYFNAKYELNV